MGIYDRHYVRDAPPPRGWHDAAGGPGGMRMWSVTTWLIVICVAVFFIDGFLPPRFVPTNNFSPPELEEVAHRLEQRTPIIATPPGTVSRISGHWVALVDPGTGLHVGWREVMIMPFLQAHLHFSTASLLLPSDAAHALPRLEFWRLIGFQFLHGNLTHLLFNMIALYFFGPMVESYLGRKRYLAFYLLCGIFGALMYLVLNLTGYILTLRTQQPIMIPGLLFNDPSTPLVGASAGIFGVLMAGAFLAPRAVVLLFFILPMQLRTLAYAFVAIAFVSVLTGSHNAGGEAGHLGGAIAGFYFIRHPHHLHGFFDFLGRADPTSHHYRKRRAPAAQHPGVAASTREEVDRILDKISREGLQSLTDREKRILSDASRGGH